MLSRDDIGAKILRSMEICNFIPINLAYKSKFLNPNQHCANRMSHILIYDLIFQLFNAWDILR